MSDLQVIGSSNLLRSQSPSRATAGMADTPGSSLSPTDGNHIHDQSVGSFATARSRIDMISLHSPDRADAPGVPRNETAHYSPPPRRRRPQNMGLAILVIPGGGVRGLISLLISKSQLRLLQPEGEIFPYLYFDIICGTSTGGLIAILLAVLHLDIDTVIILYQKLSKKIFGKGYSRVRCLVSDAGYDRKPLEDAISEILNEYGKGRTLMEDPLRDRGCYCFVTTTHCVGQRRDVLPIRSYRVSEDQSIPHAYPWTIFDAALATSAAPGYFNRYYVSMNGQRFGFEDAGAHLNNNPSMLAWEECRRLDGLKNSLFIRLGTGSSAASTEPASSIFGMFQNKITIFKALKRHLTDVDDVHKQMKSKAKEYNTSYYSHAPRMTSKIGLADWHKTAAMEAIAAEYCHKKKRKQRQTADKLFLFQVLQAT